MTNKDIAYWKFKRLYNIDQMDFFYNFNGFVVRGSILVKQKDNASNEVTLTHMEAIGNKNMRLKQDIAKGQAIADLASSLAFRKS